MAQCEHIEKFVREVWRWYRIHKRNLPWRDLAIKDDAERAYRIMVSEVMLQQTQVSRVIIIYKRFLRVFPTLIDLARASNREVILAWRGMGYNSRVIRLRDAAREILHRSESQKSKSTLRRSSGQEREENEIIFPREMEELMSIPGIGHYTAAAIRNFAFHLPTPCIETNIRRVLHTKFFGPPEADGTWRVGDRELLKLADEVLEVALKFSSSDEAPFDGSPSFAPFRKGGQSSLCAKESRSIKKKSLSTRPALVGLARREREGRIARRRHSRRTADWHAALMDYGSLAIPKIKPRRKVRRKEPGRMVGSKHIPNRIFRGRIIEELRDAERGLSIHEIGRRVCIDWKPEEHGGWLLEILNTLEKDTLIQKGGRRFVLRS